MASRLSNQIESRAPAARGRNTEVEARKAQISGVGLNFLERCLAGTFDFLSSLHLALVLLSLLVVVLAVGTVWEARHGMRAAHADLYKSWLFVAWVPLGSGGWSLPVVLPGLLLLLPLLAVNIFAAMLSRYPWRRRHTGFLITHSGLLVLLGGSFLTLTCSIDGQLAIREGQAGNEVILLDQEVLRLQWVSVLEEDSQQEPLIEQEVPLRLGGRAWPEGQRWEVPTGHPHVRVAVTGFYPRSRAEVVYVDSPQGQPLLKVRLHGTLRIPNVPRDEASAPAVDQTVDLYVANGLFWESRGDFGPAQVVVRRLFSGHEVRDFLNPPKVNRPQGLLRVYYDSGVLDLDVERDLNRRVEVPGTRCFVEITRYDRRIGSGRSTEGPAHPGVRVRLYREGTADQYEEHVVFAGWPHFPSEVGIWQSALSWLMSRGEHESHWQARLAEALGRFVLWPLRAPVRFVLYHPEIPADQIEPGTMARLDLALGPDQQVYYRLRTQSGRQAVGEWRVGTEIDAWMGLKLQLATLRWRVVPERRVEPVSMWEDENASPAMRLEILRGKGPQETRETVWLQRFETRTLGPSPVDPHHMLRVSYDTRSLHLPFVLELKDFHIGRDPGTGRPASYTSIVQLKDPERKVDEQRIITMNEPLKYRGMKFYQSSYYEESPGKYVSVFSVGRDPGYPLKMLGSLMIVGGVLVMFYMKTYFFAPRSEWSKQFGRTRTAREAWEARKVRRAEGIS
jgi:hypothetical protein